MYENDNGVQAYSVASKDLLTRDLRVFRTDELSDDLSKRQEAAETVAGMLIRLKPRRIRVGFAVVCWA